MGEFKNVLTADQFSVDFLEDFFPKVQEIKRTFPRNKKVYKDILRGKTVAVLFYEPSTRTRFSSELASANLGMQIRSSENAKEFSSAIKGETLYDTMMLMKEYKFDVVIIRHNVSGEIHEVAKKVDIPIINAGDGKDGEHPTQAILDAYTIWENFGSLSNLKIAFVGDLEKNRAVRSLAFLLSKFTKNKFTFIPHERTKISEDILEGVISRGGLYEIEKDMKSIIAETDVLYMTRLKKEYDFKDTEYASDLGSTGSTGSTYSDSIIGFNAELAENRIAEKKGHRLVSQILTPELVKQMKKDAIILHPLPRNEEIPQEVDQFPQAKYFTQAGNGQYVRMGLLIEIFDCWKFCRHTLPSTMPLLR